MGHKKKMIKQRILNFVETAKYLGKTESTLYQIPEIQKKQMGLIKQKGVTGFDKKRLDQYLSELSGIKDE